ncbi:hypothetical protein GCM10011351_31780 [Paraliobacillus quinghaiensis]|uniref:VanZ-like domain-containing protein n=2 Tax=Paraliobacillus quinghaiensis TaxID=470815 RepID=A0A917TXL8_9BACI|nr:hypothetical protein GCM10011351_31780 [Paraliobacillus quinghaiensis]
MRLFIKVILVILLCLYLLVLSKLILFKYLSIPDIINHFTFSYYDGYYWNNHNFIPFKTIIYYLFLADINFNIRVENLAGNIIGFAPFGFILPLLSKRFRLKKVTIATFCLSLTFELIQFVFKFGSFDVDDLILNTLGGMLGYVPFYAIILFINCKRIKSVNY